MPRKPGHQDSLGQRTARAKRRQNRPQIDKGQDVSHRGADGKSFPVALPDLATELADVRCRDAILDGVLVAADDTERPDRDLLAARLEAGDTAELTYYAFDLLRYDDWDLRDRPLRLQSGFIAGRI